MISVVDNGNEIDEAAIENINELLRKSSINDSGHIGLRNVNERIKIALRQKTHIIRDIKNN